MKKNVTNFLVLASSMTLASCGPTSSDLSYDSVSGETTYGEFFFLKEAYEGGLISEGDFLELTYWNNGKKVYDGEHNEIEVDASSFVEPGTLSSEISSMIINDFYLLNKDKSPFKEEIEYGWGLSTLKISDYFGEYDGYYAIVVYEYVSIAAVVREEVIGDYTLLYPTYNTRLWKANE